MARRISWIKAARKAYLKFPHPVIEDTDAALIAVALGLSPGCVKRLRHFDGAVFEIVLRYRKEAYRVVYCLPIDNDLWVVHAFQKKSKTGIKTPKAEMDVVRSRIKLLRGMLDD